MPKFDYIRPESLTESLGLLDDPVRTSRLLAGGTDVMVYLRHEPPGFDRLVDISLLPELKVIHRDRGIITLGAGVTFTEVIESEILQETIPFLVEACRAVGGPQIRNMGTLGGNVANAAACADSLPVLVCLDAQAHLRRVKGERALPVNQLVLSPGRTQLQSNEILTHFSFEIPPPGVKTAFFKVGRRNAQAISRLTMAAMGRLEAGGRVDFIRLTPGAATPQTVRFTQAEALLLGQIPTDETITAASCQVAETMISTTGRRWSTAYKEPVITTLAERALRRVLA
jgi:CO/xanthine dehydrogenase FAD-binding subunit